MDRGTEFAIDVCGDGRSNGHVLDGDVELYLPDGKRESQEKRVLFGGEGVAWQSPGNGRQSIRIRIRLHPLRTSAFEMSRLCGNALQAGNSGLRHFGMIRGLRFGMIFNPVRQN